MLTSSQEGIPHSVPPMEKDVLCARSQTVCHSSALHSSCDDAGRSSPRRRSGRLLRTNEQKEERTKPENPPRTAKQQNMNSSFINKERSSWRNHEDQQSVDKTVKGCKRKLELPSLTSQSLTTGGATTMLECSRGPLDQDTKCAEIPPPAKRWVIGPLLQSFKSKMASFTEIVMSPVRLFKPSDSSLSNTLIDSAKESSSTSKVEPVDVEGDRKDDGFSKEETLSTPLKRPIVIQRLRFNTNSSNVSDSDEVEQRCDLSGFSQSVPEDNGSLSFSSTRDLSNQVEEPLGALDIQHHAKQTYENEVFSATSTSNSSQEKSGFTKPRLLLALTDIADTIGIRPPSLEDPDPNISSRSISLTEDRKESILRQPIRTSPRKVGKLQADSEVLSPLKSVKKASVVLCRQKSLKDSWNVYNCKAHCKRLAKGEGVPTPVCRPEKKRKATPKTEQIKGLENNESTRTLRSSLKRTKKERIEEESPTVTLARAPRNATSVDNMYKARVVVEVLECIPGTCESSEREKIGQDRASRSKTRQDFKCKTQTALGIENSISDSLSSDAMKIALIDGGLQDTSTTPADTSEYNGSAAAEAHLSHKSTSPQKTVTDESPGKSAKSRNTRQRQNNSKGALCKERRTEDLSGEQSSRDLHDEEHDDIHARKTQELVQEWTVITRRNNLRQAMSTLKTSSASPDVAQLQPDAKRPLVQISQLESQAAKKAINAVEDQRVSMSLTLQVGAKANKRNRGLILPVPMRSVSTRQWQTPRPVESRVTRRMGKLGAQSKSALVHLKDQSSVDEDDGPLNKSGLAKERKKLTKVDRQRRKCMTFSRKKDAQEDKEQSRNLQEAAVPTVPSSVFLNLIRWSRMWFSKKLRKMSDPASALSFHPEPYLRRKLCQILR